jgi:tRNA threonylcarbamoyladenosine biosynthesis protein TsaB
MKILAIETATARQSVAVLDGTSVISRADHDAAGAHVKTLVPTIDRLLQESSLALRDFGGLAVSIGPGSFTGLRVGLATALAFRLVTGLPIVPVPTLEGLAWNLMDCPLPICSVLKARTGEVYWGLYRWEHQPARRLQQLLTERVTPPSAMAESLAEPTVMVGDGWTAYRVAILAEAQGTKLVGAAPDVMLPSAVSIALAAQVRLARGEIAGPVLVPFYVQRPDAEVAQKPRKTLGRRLAAGRARVRTKLR